MALVVIHANFQPPSHATRRATDYTMTSSADEIVQDPILELSSEEGDGTHPGTEDSESDESKTESNLCVRIILLGLL